MTNSMRSSPGFWSVGPTSACSCSSAPVPPKSSNWTSIARAGRLNGQYAPRCRVIAYSGSGIETTFTQGEDNFLAALVADPAKAASPRPAPRLVVAGCLADVVEDQFQRLLAAMGVDDVVFLPGAKPLPGSAIGSETRYVLAQPYLGATAQALEARGARRIDAIFPWAAREPPLGLGHRRRFRHRSRPVRRRRRAAAQTRPAGDRALPRMACRKKIFFFPDSQLEPSLARYLHQELDADIVEVGSPYLHREHVAGEIALLPPGVLVSEGQDVDRQIDRCRAAEPDLIVCGLGLANPFEAEGRITKWSIEFGLHAHPRL